MQNNYKQSKEVWKLIKESKRVLLNCHFVPDADSIASACSLKYLIERLGKDVKVFSPSPISDKYYFIDGADEIEYIADMSKFDFSEYDLFIMADSDQWNRIRIENRPSDILKIINIDHHPTNNLNADINILNFDSSSTCEIIYEIFKDCKIVIDKDLARLLLIGILADTRFFQNQNTTPKVLKITSELLEYGVNYYDLWMSLEANYEINLVKLWGHLISNMNYDDEYNFIWTAIPSEVYSKLPTSQSVTSSSLDLIFKKITGIDFAVVMTEHSDGILHMSFRSRTENYDVASMAVELGGGGHRVASGASVEGLPFDKAVEKVLETARKYAKANRKT